MTTLRTASIEPYLAEFKRSKQQLIGADVPWLSAAREKALARFQHLGFPSKPDEDWKYTNVRRIAESTFSIVAPHSGQTPTGIEVDDYRLGLTGCHELVFINGLYHQALSRVHTLPDGVEVISLSALLAKQPQILAPYFENSDHADCFGSLNQAFFTDGVHIQVPVDTEVAAPIHLLFLTSSGSERPLVCPRIIIAGERHSKLKVIETYGGATDSQSLTDTRTEISAAEGAIVEHYKIQREGPKAFHIGQLHIAQQRDSQVTNHAISLGAALARQDIVADLIAPGASVTLNGLYLARRQHVDFHTTVRHKTPHTTSEEVYKGIVDSGGRAVFNGQVLVEKDAQKTSAHQSNKNLLLSSKAEVDTKPQLEIYADDVVCTHGATVGQLDDDALFYLRSRGIDDLTARGVLTHAFAGDVIARVDIDTLRTQTETLISNWLRDGGDEQHH